MQFYHRRDLCLESKFNKRIFACSIIKDRSFGHIKRKDILDWIRDIPKQEDSLFISYRYATKESLLNEIVWKFGLKCPVCGEIFGKNGRRLRGMKSYIFRNYAMTDYVMYGEIENWWEVCTSLCRKCRNSLVIFHNKVGPKAKGYYRYCISKKIKKELIEISTEWLAMKAARM